jgi:hypothetical protein
MSTPDPYPDFWDHLVRVCTVVLMACATTLIAAVSGAIVLHIIVGFNTPGWH